MKMENYLKPVDFKVISQELLESSHPFPPKHLHSFSDISPEDLKSITKIWPQIEKNRRLNLLHDLEQLLEADTLLCFDDIAQLGLKDAEPLVRSQAILLLGESEDPHLVSIFSFMLQHDPDLEVKVTAASALGKFVLMGELDEISKTMLTEIEDMLLKLITTANSSLLQQRALESLGFSSREEVIPLIEKAYQDKDKKWLISALIAIGRSADNRWSSNVMQMINHPDPEIRTEAIRAAGELELVGSRQSLLEMVTNKGEDMDVHLTAIWALSKIGGEDVRETLETILESADEDEAEILEEALDNLDFTDDHYSFDIFA